VSELDATESSIAFARDIPSIAAAEASEIERIEFDRLLDLLESLPGGAWSAAVPAAGGDVHSLVARIAGTYAAQGSFEQLRRQIDPRVVRMYRTPGESLGETLARVQIGDRLGHSPRELIEELKRTGPRAIRIRSMIYRPLQAVRVDAGQTSRLSTITLSPLNAARELWIRRMDISEAAEIPMGIRAEQDERILAQMIKPAAPVADNELDGAAVDLKVTEVSAAIFRFGAAAAPSAKIEVDPIALAKLVIRRRSPAATRERSAVQGDVKLAMVVLRAIHGG